VDIAYGGAFYAIVPAAQAGLKVEPRHLPQMIELGRGLKQHLEAELSIRHPDQPEIEGIYGVIFTEGDRNVTVFADGEVDRSPCGSGTSARLAVLDARGELPRGHTLVHLHHMHVLPRDLFLCEGQQHLPRGVAAANRDNETAARLHCRARLRSDDLGSLSGDRIGIREYLNFHEIPTRRLCRNVRSPRMSC